MKNKISVLLLIGQSLIALFLFWACNEQDRHLAIIGEQTIEIQELQDMYSFNPYLANIKDDSTALMTILKTLIMEKLIVDQAQREGKNKSSDNIEFLTQIEREAIIEGFWTNQIIKDIQVSEKQMRNSYLDSKVKKVVFYAAYDKVEFAEFDYQKLKKGTSLQTIAQSGPRKALFFSLDTLDYFKSPAAIVRPVFNLKESDVCPIININGQYHLFELVFELKNIATSEQEYLSQKAKIKKHLKSILIQEAFIKYKQLHLEDLSYTVNSKLLKQFIKNMSTTIFDDIEATTDPQREQLLLNTSLNDAQFPLITYGDGTQISSTEIFKRFKNAPYPIEFDNKANFVKSLFVAIKNLLDDETLIRHIRKKNFIDHAYVKTQKQMWMDNSIYKEELRHKIKLFEIEDSTAIREKLYKNLITAALNTQIKIFPDVLKKVNMNRSNTVFIKTHFSTRLVAPVLIPLAQNNKFDSYLNHLLTSQL